MLNHISANIIISIDCSTVYVLVGIPSFGWGESNLDRAPIYAINKKCIYRLLEAHIYI